MRIGCNLDEGEKIEEAISGLKGTSVAHIEPTRQDHNSKVKTIEGITKLFYFEWPVTGNYAGYICARSLPHIGEILQFSPSEILKKPISINKPSPLISTHTIPKNSWNVTFSHAQSKKKINIYIYACICIYIYCSFIDFLNIDKQIINYKSSDNTQSGRFPLIYYYALYYR